MEEGSGIFFPTNVRSHKSTRENFCIFTGILLLETVIRWSAGDLEADLFAQLENESCKTC